jgi:hypothetical protein
MSGPTVYSISEKLGISFSVPNHNQYDIDASLIRVLFENIVCEYLNDAHDIDDDEYWINIRILERVGNTIIAEFSGYVKIREPDDCGDEDPDEYDLELFKDATEYENYKEYIKNGVLEFEKWREKYYTPLFVNEIVRLNGDKKIVYKREVIK